MKPLLPCTDAELHARRVSSQRVTRKRRTCECTACLAGPRRPSHMLVNVPTRVLGFAQIFDSSKSK